MNLKEERKPKENRWTERRGEGNKEELIDP